MSNYHHSIILFVLCNYFIKVSDAQGTCSASSFTNDCACKNSRYECSKFNGPMIFMYYDSVANVLHVVDENETNEELTELPDDFFSNPSAEKTMMTINWLSISTHRLMTINSEKIGGCRSIQRLDITNCKEFYSLSSDVLTDCQSLQILTIENTQLVSLPELPSSSGCQLQSLLLSNNKVKDIPESFLFQCSQKLSMIDLSFNRLNSMPDDIFSESEVLLSLKLEHNLLRQLPPRFLHNCKKLQELVLSGNLLQEIPEDIFPEHDSSIRFLYLRNNSLTHVPPSLLFNLNILEELDLSFNKLATLPKSFFRQCPQLRRLNLESNAIQNLIPGMLDNCTNLYELNLKSNYISILPERFLSNCPSLTSLTLDANEIEMIPKTFVQRCLKLSYVSLTNNKLESMDSQLFLLANRLRTMKLNKNSLVSLPSGLTSNTTYLQLLDVSENHLDFITASQLTVGEIRPQGTVYNLSFNELDELQLGTFQFANLPVEMDLSHNNISQLQDGWSLGLQSLVILNLSYNKLTYLFTRQLMLLDNLNELNLKYNNIIGVETEAFVHLSNLKLFDLSHNSINFENFTSPLIPEKLQILNMSYNRLTRFPNTWLQLPTLQVVDISHNFIMQNDLTRNLLTYPKNKKKVPEIYVAGNRIQCSCEILTVTNKYKPKLIIKDLNDSQCILNEKLSNNSCSNVNGCPKECQCGRNENGATFVDCKVFLLKALPSREPFIITMLDISDSNITNIDSLCDPSWSNLTYLMASNAFYTRESTELMQKLCHHHLISLTTLDLAMNNITALPVNFLYGLNSLNTLNLSRNPFTNFPAKFFENSTALKQVDLSHMNLQNISKELFKNLYNLERLFLTGNNIKTVPSDAFISLISLSQLYLNNNSISSINYHTFAQLTNLTVLDLDRNFLTMSSIFDLPPSLVVLRLSSNNISGSLQGIKLPSKMTTLEISNNFLKELTINAVDFENIFLNFHLETNQIEHIFLNISSTSNDKKTLIKLYLMQNPIVCDCTIINLIKLASHQSMKFQLNNNLFIVVDNVGCSRPVFLKDKLLNELSVDSLLCEVNDSSCPDQCWCYDNKTQGVILDCHKQPMKSLPVRIPRNVQVLYINDLNKSIDSLKPLEQSQWSNITELWLRNCCQNMSKLNVTVLNELQNLEILDIDDNCKCKTSENIRFSASGVLGPCKLQLPPPVCKINEENQWIWRECTGNYFPPAYEMRPMCYLQCDNCSCYLNSMYQLVMNCTDKSMTDLPSSGPPNVNILDMSDNQLTYLEGLNNNQWSSLMTLIVRNNRLTELLDSKLPSKLKRVDLQQNLMEKPTGWLDDLLSSDGNNFMTLYLANNSWKCQCDPPTFNQGMSPKLLLYVRDINLTYCDKEGTMKPLLQAFSCPTVFERLSLVIGVSVGVFIIAGITIATIVYFWQAKAIKIWLFAHRWCICLLKEESLDDEKQFDAFISYSNEDALFVAETLLPGLENADDPGFRYKICIHERDWLGGGYIPQQIIESVQISRRTIIVLSEHFLQSTWANLEFKVAFQQALTDRVDRIIVVIPDEVPSKDEMDADLRMYITMNSYIRYKDSKFWDKLRYSMPHKVPGASIRRLPSEFIKMVRQESEAKASLTNENPT